MRIDLIPSQNGVPLSVPQIEEFKMLGKLPADLETPLKPVKSEDNSQAAKLRDQGSFYFGLD